MCFYKLCDLGRRHRLDPSMIPRSPTPPSLPVHRERKPSVSSRSSRSSEVRHRRKTESSPSEFKSANVIASPSYTDDYAVDRKKRKKKEKKHKKDKKSKKKKKRNRHQSRSTSADTVESSSSETPPSKSKNTTDDVLSDWEQSPIVEKQSCVSLDKIDTSACSPVSNDSHIASPEPLEQDAGTPPPRLKEYPPPRESPHTPPLIQPKINNSLEEYDNFRHHNRSYNNSPILIEDYSSQGHISSVNAKSPYRNPSPDVVVMHHSSSHRSSSASRRRSERSAAHRKHRRDRERMRDKRRLERSRSPLGRSGRRSRSTSYGRGRSPSTSRSKMKRYRSRSPRRDRERISPLRYILFCR